MSFFANDEAEKSYLGCILNDGDLIKESSLRPHHFQHERHRLIFKAMRDMEAAKNPVDHVTVLTELQKQRTDFGGVEYLFELSNSVYAAVNFSFYEKLILEAWKSHAATQIANDFSLKLRSTKDATLIGKAIDELRNLDEAGQGKEVDQEQRLIDWYESRVSRTEEISGIRTGYKELDKLLCGLQEQGLYILAARPAVGKTAFALNVAVNVAESGNVASFFSLEMGEYSLLDRIACSIARINGYQLQNPKRYFSDDDWKRFNDAVAKIERLKKEGLLNIFDPAAITIPEIRAKLRILKRKHPNKRHVAFIDYLQLVKPIRNDNRANEISEIARSMKETARELNLPIVALSQLSRSVEQRENKRPQMSDLRESGEIEQAADGVIFPYRDDYYDPQSERKNIVELIVAKNRQGSTGTVEVVFMKNWSLFVNMEKQPGRA